jgi:hypothetical protein
LLDATGAAGIAFTATEVVPAGPVHPFSVAITEYVPAFAEVIPVMTGFCDAEEKLFGPLHA